MLVSNHSTYMTRFDAVDKEIATIQQQHRAQSIGDNNEDSDNDAKGEVEDEEQEEEEDQMLPSYFALGLHSQFRLPLEVFITFLYF